MGNKYASIHVYGDNKQTIIKEIIEKYVNTNMLYVKMFYEELKVTNPASYEKFMKYHGLKEYDILILEGTHFISIYDESLGFESIKQKTKELSSKLENLVFLYTSIFDDGVFIMGVLRAGKLITSGNYGEELQAYEMKHKNVNFDKFCKELNIDKTEKLCSVNSSDDVKDIENIIEEQLKIKLYLCMEEVESDLLYNKVKTVNSFQIYEQNSD